MEQIKRQGWRVRKILPFIRYYFLYKRAVKDHKSLDESYFKDPHTEAIRLAKYMLDI